MEYFDTMRSSRPTAKTPKEGKHFLRRGKTVSDVPALSAEHFHQYISKSTSCTTLPANISLLINRSFKPHNEWNTKYYQIKVIVLIFVEKWSLFKEGLGQLKGTHRTVNGSFINRREIQEFRLHCSQADIQTHFQPSHLRKLRNAYFNKLSCHVFIWQPRIFTQPVN